VTAWRNRSRTPASKPAWAEEVDGRVREIDGGKVETIPWKEIRAKMPARLGQKRQLHPEARAEQLIAAHWLLQRSQTAPAEWRGQR